MIRIELVALFGLSFLILFLALWWHTRIRWQQHLNAARAVIASLAYANMSNHRYYREQIATMRRRHREEIAAYRATANAYRDIARDEETITPSPRTPLPPGDEHA